MKNFKKIIFLKFCLEKHEADDSGIYDMVIRVNFTSDERKSMKEMNYIERTDLFTLPTRINEVVDINETLGNILPSVNNVDITIDDNTMRTNVIAQKTKSRKLKFLQESFPITILGFLRSEYNKRTQKSGKLINTACRNEIHLPGDCTNGYIMNGKRKPISFNFSLSKSP